MSDILVIGGGIAGVAAAAHLAPHASVTLLEMERTLAFHTTGRSAALFMINYGGTGSRALARASKSFLMSPPEGSTDSMLVTPRGVLWVSDAGRLDELEAIARDGASSGADSRLIDVEETMRLAPAMNRDWIAGGVYEPDALDIDVAGLHQAFVRIARQADASIVTAAPVTALDRVGATWRVTAGGKTHEADVVVNAAGAWGDVVGRLAGLEPIGLQPMRRTAFMVPGNDDLSALPVVADVGHRFYFKPDGVQLLCSLAEETPTEPTDPKPRMEDVALAIERINEATTLDIRTVNSEWTGLRTFAPDREMVIGEEPTDPGFFWLVGQGGTGILTSPAYGALLASLVLGSELPAELADAGVDPALTDPARFR